MEDSLRKLKEKCEEKAVKRHEDDSRAVSNVQSALRILATHLQHMLAQSPTVKEVAGRMINGIDPLSVGDMRGCYSNLLKEYRNSGEIAMTVLLVGGIMESMQGDRTAGAHIRKQQELLATMKKIGKTEFTAEELVAYLTIAGYSKTARTDYLKQEYLVKATRDSETKCENRGIWDRVVQFSLAQEERSKQQERFAKLQDTKSNNSSSNNQKADQSAKTVFATDNKSGAGSSAAKSDSGAAGKSICRDWLHGNCSFGEKCRFSHPPISASRSSHCYSWAKRGMCSRGNDCPWAASHTTKAMVVEESFMGGEDSGKGYPVIYATHKVQSDDLLFDSCANVSLADPDLIDNADEVTDGFKLQGIGGVVSVTHKGSCAKFGMKEAYGIAGQDHPNILSVAQKVKEDERGEKAIMLFSNEGARSPNISTRSAGVLIFSKRP